MAGNARFHSKWHRRAHHTLPTIGYPDSGLDPIASYVEPFQGDVVINGSLSASQNLSATNAFINGNATINGSLSVYGTMTYLDTIVSVTSALSVINVGTGPALTVMQYGAQPIARFWDGDATTPNNDALFIENNGQVVFTGTTPSLDRRVTIGGTLSASGNVEFQSGFVLSGISGFAANSGQASGQYSTALNSGSAHGANSFAANFSVASGSNSSAFGSNSVAGGNNSVAMGVSARAVNNNSFVFSGNTNYKGSSSNGDNSFTVYASGGINLFDNVTVGDPLSTTAFIVASTGYVGIQTTTPNATLTVNGSISSLGPIYSQGIYKTFNTINSNGVTLLATNDIILADATSYSPLVIYLPVANTVAGKTFIIKKIDSSAHLVTITATGSDTIDGASSISLSSQYTRTNVVSNGVVWYVF